MATFISHSPSDSEQLGASWAANLVAGQVIALTGDLGAGKTQLVKGIARGLGIPARVHSPTFALLNVYGGGRLKLYHMDLYRLRSADEVLAAGLDEPLRAADGVVVIEWAEKWFEDATAGPGLPARRVVIEALSETERRITYEDIGA
jgi:tRNA threonylcarbamoyladenosine biosynthesis protein TsaE